LKGEDTAGEVEQHQERDSFVPLGGLTAPLALEQGGSGRELGELSELSLVLAS
jgi:hypothetical protein